jgi:hypothetical protein
VRRVVEGRSGRDVAERLRVRRAQRLLQEILDAPVELIPTTDLEPGVRLAAFADLVAL